MDGRHLRRFGISGESIDSKDIPLALAARGVLAASAIRGERDWGAAEWNEVITQTIVASQGRFLKWQVWAVTLTENPGWGGAFRPKEGAEIVIFGPCF